MQKEFKEITVINLCNILLKKSYVIKQNSKRFEVGKHFTGVNLITCIFEMGQQTNYIIFSIENTSNFFLTGIHMGHLTTVV